MTANIDKTSYAKLAQIYNACYYSRSNEKNVEKILENNVDINFKVPASSSNQFERSDLSGNTPLHFAYHTEKIRIFDFLLSCSADYTLKNAKDCTVLHEVVQCSYRLYSDPQKNARQLNCPFVNSILAAHVKDGNFTNPSDEYGISHFHGACIANNVQAVELFLDNGVLVDQVVNADSPYFAGYTAMHFAVRYGSLEAARILLQRGANVRLKDAKGLTPLHLLVNQSVNMIDWINTEKDMYHRRFSRDLKVNEEMIDAFINYNHKSDNPNVVDDTGLSYFHLACTLQDTSVVESLLKHVKDINHAVRADSPICPRYTAAHFAALFNVNTLKLLLRNGANAELKDANGVTSFDLCLERYDAADIHFILSSEPAWKNILLSDNKTSLLDVVLSMRDPIEFEAFLERTALNVNTFVPSDSPLWPKYTILHLAVTLSEKFKEKSNYSLHPAVPVRLFKPCLEMVKKCLDHGGDITAQDCRGRTPLHLAFKQFKVNTVDLLLQYHKEPMHIEDEDGLSHLHVACAAKNVSLSECFLSNGADIQSPLKYSLKWYNGPQYRNQAGDSTNLTIASGWTLLHIAVGVESREMVELLLKHDANPYAKDDNGKTPIHLIFGLRRPKPIAGILLSSPDLRDVVTTSGLSHLHVTTFMDNATAVGRLLDQGINPNLVHNEPQTYYEGYTPLGIAIEKNCSNVIGLLIQRGADIFARNPKESSIIYKFFSFPNRWYLDQFVDRLKRDEVARKFMEEDSGVTMLHIACHVGDVEAVRSLLNDGVDANAKSHEDSELWPSLTPLHVLTMPSRATTEDGVKVMMQLLLDHGADVTLADAQGRTPVHLAARDLDLAFLLLKHHKTFNINPKSPENFSHFHLACLANDTTMVEEFLKFGVSPNEPVDYFSLYFAGCSPLHLALSHRSTNTSSRLTTIGLLLLNGADVNAEDALGNTPLHIAANCKSDRLDLLKKLYSAEADIKAIDIFGKTPFEVLICSENDCTVEEMDFFLKNGYYLNNFNSVNQAGYIALIFSRQSKNNLQEHILEMMKGDFHHTKLDDRGRTIIHNIVSTSPFVSDCSESGYVDVIKKFMKFGYDIDDQDKLGKTPLHIAAAFGNLPVVSGLLKIGADANVTDENGGTAFSDALDAYNRCEGDDRYEYMEVIATFVTHIRFLEICGLPINEINIATQKTALRNFQADAEKINRFIEQVEKTKNVKIGTMSLSSLLSETEAVNGYIDKLESERCAVDEFFQEIDKSDFDEVNCILNLHYRKALARLNAKE